MIEFLITNVISGLIVKAINNFLIRKEKTTNFDYLLSRMDNTKIAIEILSRSPSDKKINQLFKFCLKNQDKINEFLLITPFKPDKKRWNYFQSIFESSKVKANWIDLNHFPQTIGLGNIGDLNDPKVIDKIHTEALISNIKRYKKAPIGLVPHDIEEVFQKECLDSVDFHLPFEYERLDRQFSYSVLSKLYRDNKPLNDLLKVGEKCLNVTVVLADIKNFSSLVKVARSNDLNEIMRKYYTNTREMVWDHHAMLDKFIGDSVLAIFDYPYQSDNSMKSAITFAKELIILAKRLLGNLLMEINEYVETGTRVGIATGDLWPLDIGHKFLEISLIGDTINLAARLEKNCLTNGILLDNRSKTKISKIDPVFFEMEDFKEKIIKPVDAKGQILSIRAWQSKIY